MPTVHVTLLQQRLDPVDHPQQHQTQQDDQDIDPADSLEQKRTLAPRTATAEPIATATASLEHSNAGPTRDETQVCTLAIAVAGAGQLARGAEVVLGQALLVVQAGGEDALDLAVGQEEGVGLEAELGVVGDREAEVRAGEDPGDARVRGRVTAENGGEGAVALHEGEDVRVGEVVGYEVDQFCRERCEGRRRTSVSGCWCAGGAGSRGGWRGRARLTLRLRLIFFSGAFGRGCF